MFTMCGNSALQYWILANSLNNAALTVAAASAGILKPVCEHGLVGCITQTLSFNVVVGWEFMSSTSAQYYN